MIFPKLIWTYEQIENDENCITIFSRKNVDEKMQCSDPYQLIIYEIYIQHSVLTSLLLIYYSCDNNSGCKLRILTVS